MCQPQPIDTLLCPHCDAELSASAERCGHCGTATGFVVAEVVAADRGVEVKPRIFDQPGKLLILLFGVTAVFGLPLLWHSRGFSRPAKAVLTVVVLAYTVLILWAFWLLMRWCYGSISQSLRQL